jgi:ubiquitin-conjugating enzyme E2 J2
MAQKSCLSRLQKEYRALLREPVPHVEAHPTTNLLEWHFVLTGAEGTDFEGGVYHGRLVFPPTYPFKPPSISVSL